MDYIPFQEAARFGNLPRMALDYLRVDGTKRV